MIKKITAFIILAFTFLMTLPANAAIHNPALLCAQPYDLSMAGTRFFYNVTGSTLLTQAIAQSIIKKELKKATGEKFKVKMKSYSAKDLADGRFKSLMISGQNIDIDGVFFTSINSKTLCDFNYVQLEKNTIKFKENLLMSFSVVISDSDLKKTMISSDYLALLGMLNLKSFGFNLFEIKNVDIKIYNGKFYFILETMNKILNAAFPVNIVISSSIKVQDGNIMLADVSLDNFDKKINMQKLTQVLNLINPLNFSIDVLDNKNTQMQVNTIEIINDTILIDGTVLVPKNVVQSVK